VYPPALLLRDDPGLDRLLDEQLAWCLGQQSGADRVTYLRFHGERGLEPAEPLFVRRRHIDVGRQMETSRPAGR
jgi:hypothetical protein